LDRIPRRLINEPGKVEKLIDLKRMIQGMLKIEEAVADEDESGEDSAVEVEMPEDDKQFKFGAQNGDQLGGGDGQELVEDEANSDQEFNEYDPVDQHEIYGNDLLVAEPKKNPMVDELLKIAEGEN
jgi:hypothetical protein